MISKSKYIEICLLKASDAITHGQVIKEAAKNYDKMMLDDEQSGSHHKAMSVLSENYIRRMQYFEKVGVQGGNPVWMKEEVEALRAIWDSFALLRRITINNSEDKAEIWHIGKRP